MDEQAIIGLFFARDERAIEAFTKTCGGLCLRVALDITGDEGAAEECLNDVCLRLWNAIPPAKPRSLRAYALRIARNLALNRLEKDRAGKRRAVVCELDEVAEASRVSFEGELVDAGALTAILNRFLARHTRVENFVFVRRYFSGESARDIAAELGIGEPKVSRMLKRLRRELAGDLKKGGFEV